MREIDRRYLRQFWPAMAAYVVAVFVCTTLLHHVQASWLRIVLALAPMLPVIAVVRAMLHRVLGGDELERRIELEAACISAMTVGLLSFSYGLLEAANESPFGHESMMLGVLPALFFTYGLAKCWAVRRYR
jgi:ABC-type transport system involved in cytochrome bd biosynthesis fused ATPase/permease subunit